MIIKAILILGIVASVAAQQASSGKWFDHYVLVMLENLDIATALTDGVFQNVASTGILQSNYHGVTHPSQPNCE